MAKELRMYYILCMVILWLPACKKQAVIDEVKTTPEVVVPVVPKDPDPTPNTPTYAQTYEIGTGSGDLSINGSAYSFNGNTLFKIKGGKYKSIKIANIDGGINLVTIQNDGLVEMVNAEMRLENLNNVTITGNGTAGIEKGFIFSDNNYRSIQVDGSLDNFTLQYFSFKNIRDYVFTYKYQKLYDGTEKSYSKNLKFLNIDCDNTGTLIAGDGSISSGKPLGLLKNVEVAFVNFKNSPSVGTIVYFGNVENYDIHDNVVNNINTNNDNHNGIFMIKGNGKFHNNYISNHQGNAIRAWCFTLGSTPKNVLIYNNIVLNSRKYSPFEVQSFDDYLFSGISTFVNAKVFNNTCGNINLSKSWQGNVVDVYSLKGGTCDVYNNLAYNLNNESTDKAYIAGQQSGLTPVESNNLYYKTSREAGIIDEASSKISGSSPAKNKGKYDSFLITDYYGSTRSSTPSIGAVE